MTRPVVLGIVLTCYIMFLLDIALFRFPMTSPQPNWVPFRSISNDWHIGGWGFVINFLGNIVAFMPFGLLPPLIRDRRTALWQVALFSLSISLTIEMGQYISGRRVPDVDDLFLNTVGGVMGYSVWACTRARRTRLKPELQRALVGVPPSGGC